MSGLPGVDLTHYPKDTMGPLAVDVLDKINMENKLAIRLPWSRFW
jgi:hypothetical protein